MVSFANDAEGNRLTRTRVADDFVTAYEWDHRNRLVSVTELDDEETVLAETTHDYDAFNQWIRRTADADGPGSGDPTSTIFAHHDGQIVYQFDGDSAADLTNRYLWNPAAVDHLLVDEVVANLSTAGDLQFPLGDHLNTIRDIAEYNATTNTTTIANHIRYSSFGAVISETNSAIDLLFGFTSRPLDESTDLQNNLNRWYNGKMGKWMSEDPIGFAGGDFNLSRYIGGNVLAASDPSGLRIVPHFIPEDMMSEAQKRDAMNRLRQLLSEIADEDRETIGGCLARAALNGQIVLNVWFSFGVNGFARDDGKSGTMWLHPAILPPKIEDPELNYTTKDGERLSNDQVAKILLVHELGHAFLNLADPTKKTPRGTNVTLCENAYRSAMGYSMRGEYTKGVPLPDENKSDSRNKTAIENFKKKYPFVKKARGAGSEVPMPLPANP